jgi:hypothetical protein
MTHLNKPETALILLSREKPKMPKTFNGKMDRVIRLIKRASKLDDHRGFYRNCVCDYCNTFHEIDTLLKAADRQARSRSERIISMIANVKSRFRKQK